MQIVNSLIPIFAVIGLGVILRRSGFLTEESTSAFNRFAYYIALPLFLFHRLGAAAVSDGPVNQFVLTLLSASVLSLVVGWALTYVFKTRYASKGAQIQSCFRGNLAFMGLPLILFTTADLPVEVRSQLESAVLFAISALVIFYNVAAVAVLSIYNQQTESHFSWIAVVRNIVVNPILIGCLGGVVMQQTGSNIPVSIERTCQVVGASAFPLALLGIGSQLASISVVGRWQDALVASCVKCVFCPVAGWVIGLQWGLDAQELQVILILCAVPTAVSSYVLADQMHGDSELAASTVVIATAFSLVTLSVLLLVTG